MEKLLFDLVFVAILASCAVLLSIPVWDEGRRLSVMCAGAIVAAPALVLSAGLRPEHACASVMAVLAVYLVMRNYARYKATFHVSNKVPKSCRVAMEARLFYSALCLLLGCHYMLLRTSLPWWGMISPAVVLLIVLVYRVAAGVTLFVSVKPGRSLRVKAVAENLSDVGAFKRIYDRAEKCMAEKKPYLEGKVLEHRFAGMLGVNRNDLSRALSWYGQKNFNQYMNGYRIAYATDLMTRDPYMKVTEAGRLSGFSSEGNFTSVFKKSMGQTPSEFMRHERYKRERSDKLSQIR